MPVTQDFIQQRALLAKQELLDSESAEVDKEALISFAASIGWVQKFVKRHIIDSMLLHGQADSADVTKAAEDIAKLSHKLADFEPSNICNVDETGLFTSYDHAVLMFCAPKTRKHFVELRQ